VAPQTQFSASFASITMRATPRPFTVRRAEQPPIAAAACPLPCPARKRTRRARRASARWHEVLQSLSRRAVAGKSTGAYGFAWSMACPAQDGFIVVRDTCRSNCPDVASPNDGSPATNGLTHARNVVALRNACARPSSIDAHANH
jgi:hypothetical protein